MKKLTSFLVWVLENRKIKEMKLKFIPILFALLITFSFKAQAAPYEILKDESSISFHGEHAGQEFQGSFNNYTSEIDFDFKDLNNSYANVIFNLQYIEMNKATYEGTLPNKDWFHIAEYPVATFKSKSFSLNDQNGLFDVVGDLTIRDVTKEIAFSAKIVERRDGVTTVDAEFPINRLDYNLGQKSDPTADWVSEEIKIKLDLIARKQ